MLGDEELVGAAQRGDGRSLGVLLERYRPSLYARALRTLGRGPQAHDAVQETALVALRKIGEVRDPAAVGAWLHAVMRNVCRMRLREDRGELPFEELSARLGGGGAETSVEEAVERLALREWVWTALAELSEAQRVTLMLRYFGAHATYAEIAATLGVPVGTVRSRLSEGKARLAEALLQTAGGDHTEARRLAEGRARFFRAAWDEVNRGEGYELFASAMAPDAAFGFSDGSVEGRAWMVREFEGDLEAGMKLRLTNVLSSRGVSVVEGDYENPREDPFRCPPAISMVAYYRDGRIPRMQMYFAPRPEKEVSEEEKETQGDQGTPGRVPGPPQPGGER